MNILLNLASYYSGSSYSSSYSPSYSSSYSSSDIDPEVLFGGMSAFLVAYIGIIILVVIVSIVIAVIEIVAQWKTFKKAGRKGWEVLIPYHVNYVLMDMSNINPAFIFLLMFGTLIPFVGSIAVIVLNFYINIQLAKSFGKGAGFGVGLTLLGFVFWPILGFGNSQYVGTYYSNRPENNNIPNQPTQNV